MKRNQIEEGRFSQNARGLGTATREVIYQRAREIAVINGRRPDRVLNSDFAQARRELTGEERLVPEDSAEDKVPEESRWEPNPESTGHHTPPVPAPDEQTFAEQLVEEGVQEAEHDQMLRAAKEAEKRDKAA